MKNLCRFFAVALVALMVGCGGGLTTENYDKLESGMTKTQVEEILGEPTEQSSVGAGPLSGGTATWKDGDKTVIVTYANDKVAAYVKEGF